MDPNAAMAVLATGVAKKSTAPVTASVIVA